MYFEAHIGTFFLTNCLILAANIICTYTLHNTVLFVLTWHYYEHVNSMHACELNSFELAKGCQIHCRCQALNW